MSTNMSTKKERIALIARWNKVYKKGAHWEKGPSKNIQEFVRYLKKGDKILDLGCGSGRDSIFLAKQGYEVWGIDISKEAIKKAKKKFKRFQAENLNLHLLIADLENLPFKDEFFDAIYSGGVLQFVSLEKASSEIFRVLKKNGIAFLAFLLNTKIIATGKLIKYHKKEDIISIYRRNFKILKQIEFKSKDIKAKEPHTHDAFIMILKK